MLKIIDVYKRQGKKTKLSKQEGTHKAIFSNNMKYYINTFSNINTPPVITLNDNNGKELATLVDNNTLKHQVSRLNMPNKELFSFKTNDEMCIRDRYGTVW